MSGTGEQRGTCPVHGDVPAVPNRPDHLLHLTLTVLTLGLWAIVWIGLVLKPQYRCPFCGEGVSQWGVSAAAKRHQVFSPGGQPATHEPPSLGPREKPSEEWVEALVQYRASQGGHSDEELEELETYRDTLLRRYELGPYTRPTPSLWKRIIG